MSAVLADLEQPLWSVADLAAFCGVSVQTVYEWRKTGRGPNGIRVGRHLKFHVADVDRWLADLGAAAS